MLSVRRSPSCRDCVCVLWRLSVRMEVELGMQTHSIAQKRRRHVCTFIKRTKEPFPTCGGASSGGGASGGGGGASGEAAINIYIYMHNYWQFTCGGPSGGGGGAAGWPGRRTKLERMFPSRCGSESTCRVERVCVWVGGVVCMGGWLWLLSSLMDATRRCVNERTG